MGVPGDESGGTFVVRLGHVQMGHPHPASDTAGPPVEITVLVRSQPQRISNPVVPTATPRFPQLYLATRQRGISHRSQVSGVIGTNLRREGLEEVADGILCFRL